MYPVDKIEQLKADDSDLERTLEMMAKQFR
jgi:hypothetical protein